MPVFRELAAAATLAVLLPIALLAQDQPSTGAGSLRDRKLAFVIPNLFGPEGLLLDNDTHRAHFDSSFRANFGPFNTAIASQLTSLPIPSPASGFTYTFDESLGTYSRTATSFGPILAERSETIGKDRFSFGLTSQHFGFNQMDELPLESFPVVFEHSRPADPRFLQDVITTQNVLNVQIDQLTLFFTFGVTDSIDLSVALPYLHSQMDVLSTATIRRIGTAGDPAFPHTFRQGQNVDQRQFENGASAAGLGDVVFRLKANVRRWESAGLALAADLRLPTGDELDFLGTGAAGFKPFIVYSRTFGRVSPHVNVGYQFNGQSVLGGDPQLGLKADLPDQFLYTTGVDFGVSQRLSFAVDLIGQRLVDSERVVMRPFVAANEQVFDTIGFEAGGVWMTDLALGFKVNPVRTLLVTFNVLARANDGGLRDDFVPLIGVSFTP